MVWLYIFLFLCLGLKSYYYIRKAKMSCRRRCCMTCTYFMQRRNLFDIDRCDLYCSKTRLDSICPRYSENKEVKK